MATDGIPKDYSSMYCEDNANNNNHHGNNLHHHRRRTTTSSASASSTTNATSNLALAANLHINKPPVPSSRATRAMKSLDGTFVPPKHREQAIDLREVVARLQNLPKENHRAYAMDTLNEHYSSVFVNRRKSSSDNHAGYRAYIQYFDAKDTYVVRVDSNTLKAVRDKLPRRGNYRYFFKNLENTIEEIEFDEAVVPFHDKGGLKQIYCQVFPF